LLETWHYASATESLLIFSPMASSGALTGSSLYLDIAKITAGGNECLLATGVACKV